MVLPDRGLGLLWPDFEYLISLLEGNNEKVTSVYNRTLRNYMYNTFTCTCTVYSTCTLYSHKDQY